MGSITSYGEVGGQGQGSLGPVFSKARPAPTLDNSGTLSPGQCRLERAHPPSPAAHTASLP